MKNRYILSLTTALTMSAFASPAQANEYFEPYFNGGIVLEWQNEYRSQSDDTDIDETNNAFMRGEFVPVFGINKNLFIDGVVVFEPLDQAATLNAGDDIWFDRHGALIEEFKFNYSYDNATFMLGKFNPVFGIAWNPGRGVWGEDFAEDYELTEKIGASASYNMDLGGAGSHTATLAVFRNDRSELTSSVITKRDKATLNDGGAGNTNGYESYNLSLIGENAAGVENLGYQIAYRHLGEQDQNRTSTTSNETGATANISYLMPINDDLELELLGEVVAISNNAGVLNDDYNYYTGSVKGNFYKNWTSTFSFTEREIDSTGTASDFSDELYQISGGYLFDNGFSAEAGYRLSEESDQDTDMLGFLVRYAQEF